MPVLQHLRYCRYAKYIGFSLIFALPSTHLEINFHTYRQLDFVVR